MGTEIGPPHGGAGGGGGGGGIDLSLSGNTSGVLALISTGTAILAGGANITLSQAGQSITISGATAAAGSFTAGISGGNTSGNTGTVTNQFVLAGGNNITLSGSTGVGGMTATISAFNQSVQTQNVVDLSLSGNTSGALALISSGTVILAGGNNITLSQAGQSITISANVETGAAISIGGNSTSAGAGFSNISTGTAILAGGNNITLSQNGASITISAFTQTVQTQNVVDLSLAGNTAGALALVSSGTAILAGGNNITLSQNGQSITISENVATLQKFFWPLQQVFSSSLNTSSVSNGVYYFQYLAIPNYVSFSRVDLLVTCLQPSTTASAVTAAVGVSQTAVLYSLSASSTMNPIVGNTTTFLITWASNVTSNIFGARFLSFPLATLISPGEYWLGLNISTSSGVSFTGAAATTALAYTMSHLFMSGMLSTSANVFGDFNVATNSSSNVQIIGAASTPSATNNTYNLNIITMSGSAFARANMPVVLRNY